MDLLLQGIGLGLALSLLAGPILFTLIQTSLDQGVRSGLTVASGIWISDILYITTIFLAFSFLDRIAKMPDFEFFFGLIGGVILIAIGIGMIMSTVVEEKIKEVKSTTRAKSALKNWMKGFLINTVNPFTVFFWIGIVSTTLGVSEFTFAQIAPFFLGLMITVMVGDIVKVFLASRIRKVLTKRTILVLRKISGSALILFGVILIARVTI
jgi:threonine/homoserine/homoserine lactone efflux protein